MISTTALCFITIGAMDICYVICWAYVKTRVTDRDIVKENLAEINNRLSNIDNRLGNIESK